MKTLIPLLVLLIVLPAHAEPLRILALGDSITKGVRPGVKADETFAAVVEKSLRQRGVKVDVVNAGVGGETTVGALKRLDKDVIAKKPHLVVIMYGTNDCYVDKGKTESRVAIKDFEANLASLIERLRKEKIEVVLMTEPAYAENGPKNGIGEASNVRLGQYMKVVRAVAKDKKTPLVDHFAAWSALMEKGMKLGPWTTDGYHPSPRGHEDLGMRIVEGIWMDVQRLADKYDAREKK